MKKLLFTLLVLVITCTLAGPVMAGGVKVPKQLCLEWGDSSAYYTQLSFKAQG